MKPEHPKFAHMKDKELQNQKEIPVYTVADPRVDTKTEAEFIKEMNDLAHNITPSDEVLNAPAVDDAIVQKEKERKQSLEKLVMFRQPTTKIYKIGGVDFRFKVLNVKENAIVYQKIRELSPEEQLSKSPVLLLAASLVDANGLRIEENYNGPAEITDPITQKYHELSNWNMPIINALVAAYSEFTKEIENGYKKDFLDKSPKTPTTD